MSADPPPDELQSRYRDAIVGYVSGDAASALDAANRFGRDAVSAGWGLLDVLDLHADVTLELTDRLGTDVDAMRELQRAHALLTEAIAPFEMLTRGYRVANERLHGMVDELTRLDRLKDEFVSMVAHDMRTPMTVITGFSQTLLDRWDDLDEDQRRQFLRLMRDSADRLSRLIENVLQVAHIEAGELSFETTEFDVRALVEAVRSDLVSAEEADRVHVRVPDGLPRALADAQRQWQVVANLLSNALKYSRSNSPVWISAEIDADEPNMLRVSVEDRGVGIDQGQQRRLFEKFSRVDATSDTAPGTGLGLYITRRLVEAQGGTIDVTSTPGVGSRFTFTMPAAATAVVSDTGDHGSRDRSGVDA